jgi:hypothetical protein
MIISASTDAIIILRFKISLLVSFRFRKSLLIETDNPPVDAFQGKISLWYPLEADTLISRNALQPCNTGKILPAGHL